MNNHELSGNPESAPIKTEWDTLGEEVEFNPDQEKTEDGSEKFDSMGFVYEKYGKTMEALIENACFEGGDKTNPSNYVLNMILSDAFTDDEQQRMIQTYTKYGKIHDAFSFKIMAHISKTLDNARPDFLGEIKSDPYLRGRRIDNLAGRTHDDLNEDEEKICELLGFADQNFYESEEVRNLFSDETYLEKTYANIFKHAAPSEVNETAEDARAKALQNMPTFFGAMIDDGIVSAKELIEDPYLREKHFDSLSRPISGEDLKESEWNMRELWNYDDEFFDSSEYNFMLAGKVRENPDIYKDVDTEEVGRLTNEALEQILLKDFKEILKAYEKDSRKGDELVFQKLLPILGLTQNPPKLEYGAPKDEESGFYHRQSNRVVICEDTIKQRAAVSNSSFEQKKKSIFDFLRKKQLDNEIFDRINTIAHETWHAHQWVGENVEEPRRKKYQENFVYYMEGRTGYDTYRAQLIEREAWEFGGKVEAISRMVYKETKGGSK